jgi:MYXO-CTERM domain-containing protein
MEVTGRVRAYLYVDIDQPDADLMVRLTDVYPDGRSMLITDGAVRLAARGSKISLSPLSPDEIVLGVVDLWSTSIILAAGHELRISVTSSNSPRFAASRNNALPWPESVQGDGEPVTVRLHHEPAFASYLEVQDPGREMVAFQTCGEEPPGHDDDGCACRSSQAGPSGVAGGLLAGLLLAIGGRRRKRGCRVGFLGRSCGPRTQGADR